MRMQIGCMPETYEILCKQDMPACANMLLSVMPGKPKTPRCTDKKAFFVKALITLCFDLHRLLRQLKSAYLLDIHAAGYGCGCVDGPRESHVAGREDGSASDEAGYHNDCRESTEQL